METILPYLINSVFGAGGGWLSNMLKPNALGGVGNILAGAIGGNALQIIGSLSGMFANSGSGGFDWMSALTALIGGGAGSMLGGLLKK